MVDKKISEYMRAIGRRGGEATAKKGKAYMSKIGKKGYEKSIEPRKRGLKK